VLVKCGESLVQLEAREERPAEPRTDHDKDMRSRNAIEEDIMYGSS